MNLSDSLRASPCRDEITLELFLEAAALGLTTTLVVAKDAEAAAVYYFRDGLRAFESYQRLCKLSSQPLVITISPDGRGLGQVAVRVESSLERRGLSWLPGLACSSASLMDALPRRAAAARGSSCCRRR